MRHERLWARGAFRHIGPATEARRELWLAAAASVFEIIRKDRAR
jgi:hypothetical protein